MPETCAPAARRPLNVSLLAGSGAYRAYYDRSGSSVSELTADALAAGFPPRPALNLRFFGGRTIAHLVFASHYLGGAAAWVPDDIASIDAALAATIYHQLNEARTDPDVDDAIRTGDSTGLGWYSDRGGEIGDIPVKEAGTSLALVFREVDLADGSGAVPVQLMWSNKAEAPAPRIA
jgi:hypothetical protein